jgi:Tfp pilus assembly protein PilF
MSRAILNAIITSCYLLSIQASAECGDGSWNDFKKIYYSKKYEVYLVENENSCSECDNGVDRYEAPSEKPYRSVLYNKKGDKIEPKQIKALAEALDKKNANALFVKPPKNILDLENQDSAVTKARENWWKYETKRLDTMNNNLFEVTGAKEMKNSNDCPIKFETLGQNINLYVIDSETKNKMYLSLFQNKNLEETINAGDYAQEFTGLGCYKVDEKHSVAVMTVSSNNGCSWSRNYTLVFFDPSKIEPMQMNILGYRSYKEKKYDTAIANFKKSLAIDPNYNHANFNLACTMAIQGKTFSEGKIYLDALLNNPNQTLAYIQKIGSDKDLVSWRKTPEFKTWFETVKIQSGIDFENNAFLNNVHNDTEFKSHKLVLDAKKLSAKKNYKIALQKLIEAHNIDPNYLEAVLELAKVSVANGDTYNAQEYLTAAGEMNPKVTAKILNKSKDLKAHLDKDWLKITLERLQKMK